MCWESGGTESLKEKEGKNKEFADANERTGNHLANRVSVKRRAGGKSESKRDEMRTNHIFEEKCAFYWEISTCSRYVPDFHLGLRQCYSFTNAL